MSKTHNRVDEAVKQSVLTATPKSTDLGRLETKHRPDNRTRHDVLAGKDPRKGKGLHRHRIG